MKPVTPFSRIGVMIETIPSQTAALARCLLSSDLIRFPKITATTPKIIGKMNVSVNRANDIATKPKRTATKTDL